MEHKVYSEMIGELDGALPAKRRLEERFMKDGYSCGDCEWSVAYHRKNVFIVIAIIVIGEEVTIR